MKKETIKPIIIAGGGVLVFIGLIVGGMFILNLNDEVIIYGEHCEILRSENLIALTVFSSLEEEIPERILNRKIKIDGVDYGKVSDYRDYKYSRYVDKSFLFEKETITEYINEPREINNCFKFGYEPPIAIVLNFEKEECKNKDFEVCLIQNE